MTYTASDVAELRASTGAGILDCKSALEEAGGDKEKASDILRKKGIIKGAKRAGKIAAEGMTLVTSVGDDAVILELNCETDFVAATEDFIAGVKEVGAHLLATKPANLEDALATPMIGGATLGDFLAAKTGKTGEKTTLRRFAFAHKTANGAFGEYLHLGGKIGVLVHLEGTTDHELAKEIAMHIAAANPRYVDRAAVPAEVIAREKEIYAEQMKGENKPTNIVENILNAKLNKFYADVCVVDQQYIKDEEKTVAQVLAARAAGATIAAFMRYELGEGIVKEEKNFAEEVAEQLK